MSRRDPLASAPTRRRTVRIALTASVGAGLALVTALHAAVLAFGRERPGLALQIVANDPDSLNRLALRVAALAAQDTSRLSEIGKLAERSIRAQALNPQAVRLLAMSRGERIDRGAEVRLLQLASTLSRRDAGTQALLIDYYAREEDLAPALDAFDNLLRTKPNRYAESFPILERLLHADEVRPFFRSFMEQRPPWIGPFLVETSLTTDQPAFYTDLIIETGGLGGIDRADVIRNRLIARLIDQDADYARARQVFLLDPEMSENQLRSPAISAQSLAEPDNRLLWQLYSANDWGAEALADRAFSAYSSTLTPQVVARKLLFVSPGAHELSLALTDVEIAPGGRAGLSVSCAASADVPEQALAEAAIRPGDRAAILRFVVPPKCSIVRLDFVLAGNEARQESGFLVTQTLLRRRAN